MSGNQINHGVWVTKKALKKEEREQESEVRDPSTQPASQPPSQHTPTHQLFVGVQSWLWLWLPLASRGGRMCVYRLFEVLGDGFEIYLFAEAAGGSLSLSPSTSLPPPLWTRNLGG